MNDIKKQVNNHFLHPPANEQKETGISRMEEGDYVVTALANSWSIEAPVEITMQLLGSWL